MADLTEAQAQTQLDLWIACDTAISTGKAYTIGNRALTRADAAEVRGQLTYWRRAVKTLAAKALGLRNPGVAIASWK